MTVGITLPTDGMTSAAFEQQQDRAWEQGQRQQLAERHGRQMMGYTEGRRPDGSFGWTRRGGESIPAGLPGQVVQAARDAVAADVETARALALKVQESHEYIRQHPHLSDAAQRVHQELHSADAYSARDRALNAVTAACTKLGAVALQVEEARVVIDAAPARKQQLEAEYKTLVKRIEDEEQRARGVLLRLGVT